MRVGDLKRDLEYIPGDAEVFWERGYNKFKGQVRLVITLSSQTWFICIKDGYKGLPKRDGEVSDE